MATVMVSVFGMTVCAEPQKRGYDLCFVNTNGGNLNGRSGPGTEYSVICQFANGTEVFWSVMPSENAKDTQGRWWWNVRGTTTKGEDMEAWVLYDYLRFEPNPDPCRNGIILKVDPDMPSVG